MRRGGWSVGVAGWAEARMEDRIESRAEDVDWSDVFGSTARPLLI